jgi:hypothetical protein
VLGPVRQLRQLVVRRRRLLLNINQLRFQLLLLLLFIVVCPLPLFVSVWSRRWICINFL